MRQVPVESGKEIAGCFKQPAKKSLGGWNEQAHHRIGSRTPELIEGARRIGTFVVVIGPSKPINSLFLMRIGIDTGGTFTDFVVVRDGRIEVFKIFSTPREPETSLTGDGSRLELFLPA